MITHVLFEGAVCVVSTNDGIGQLEVFDDGLKLSLVELGDLTAEDGGDLAGLADGAVDIQESLAQMIPFLAPVLDPVLKLLGDIAPAVASNPFALSIGIKEADHSLWLLKRLNQPAQKNPIKTTVAKFNAIVMVFAEGVHRLFLGG